MGALLFSSLWPVLFLSLCSCSCCSCFITSGGYGLVSAPAGAIVPMERESSVLCLACLWWRFLSVLVPVLCAALSAGGPILAMVSTAPQLPPCYMVRRVRLQEGEGSSGVILCRYASQCRSRIQRVRFDLMASPCFSVAVISLLVVFLSRIFLHRWYFCRSY